MNADQLLFNALDALSQPLSDIAREEAIETLKDLIASLEEENDWPENIAEAHQMFVVKHPD